MRSWSVSAFQQENHIRIQISIKSRRDVESALTAQIEGELRFRPIFAPIERFVSASIRRVVIQLSLHSQSSQEKSLLGFGHSNGHTPRQIARPVWLIVLP
jgi:hypothetical protein